MKIEKYSGKNWNEFLNSNQDMLKRVLLRGATVAALSVLACTNVDSSDRVLFGLTEQLGAGTASDLNNALVSCDTENVTVSSTDVFIIEDGDVDRTWQSADPGFSDTDGDGGTAWGLWRTEVCVYLNTAFTGTVTIPISQNDTYSGRLTLAESHPGSGSMPASMSFTGTGSANRQCFTIERIDDGIRNAVEDSRLITLGMIEDDNVDDNEVYLNVDPCDVSITMEDDEAPGIRVSNISNVMQEPGTGGTNNGTFQVQLRTTPTSGVTVGIDSTFDAVNVGNREGTVDKTSLTFTDTTAQTVTVNSVDDLEIDGLKTYTIDVTTASSADTEYDGLEPRNVVIYNEDQSVPGYVYNITHSSTSGQTGTSGGTITGFAVDQANNMGTTYATFEISLRSKPTDDVTLNIDFNPTTNVANLVSSSSLTFTPSDWNTTQTIQVEGAADGTDSSTGNGNEDVTLRIQASSTDPTYNNGGTVTEPSFLIRSCDNDNTKLIQPCNFSGSPFGDDRVSRFSSAEPSGTSQIWLISKAASPGSSTYDTVSTDASEGTVPGTVTVDNSNYNVMSSSSTNRIVITHVDDTDLDGAQNFGITTTYNTGAVNYDPYDTLGTTTDNEQQYYVYTSGNTDEGNSGTVATVQVCLGAQNSSGTVVIDVACATPSDECGTLSASQLTFPMNSKSSATSNATCNGDGNAQSFTVNGLNDSFADGTQSFTVNLTLNTGSSTDSSGNFNSGSPSNPSINNLDDEQPGKAIFVTTTTFNGEMTAAGVQGADTICNNSSNKPSGVPSGTYKALIVGQGETNTRLATTSGSDATGQTDWALTANYYYYRCEGSSASVCSDEHTRLFQADANALFSFPMSGGRDFSTTGSHQFWTGMNKSNLTQATQSSTPGPNGSDPAIRDNCAGFTYQNGPESPFNLYYGETWTNAGSGDVTQTSNVACTSSMRVICVQQ